MAANPAIDPTYLTMICDALTELDSMVTDGELGALLVGSGVKDIFPNSTRHRRVLSALSAQQDRDGNSDSVATFLRRTAFHIQKRRGEEAFQKFKDKMCEVLTFAGYQMDSDGNLVTQDAGRMFYASADAERRAQSLNQAVKARRLHPDLLIAVRPEYMSESGYFRVLLEADRLLLEKLKARSGVGADGPAVAEQALAFPWQGVPVLTINAFATEIDRAEQFSFMCMLKALFLMFQDEATGNFRTPWKMSLEDALDLLALISFFHRKIDLARRLR